MKQWTGWAAAALAIATLLGTNISNISTLLGIAATKSQAEVERDKLDVFARKSNILYAGYEDGELGLVYYIESHPCVDYEITYSILNTVVDRSSRSSSVCEDKPELVTGTVTAREFPVDSKLIRATHFTVNGELIQSNTANVVIRWKFEFSDGTFGYHSMVAAIPLE